MSLHPLRFLDKIRRSKHDPRVIQSEIDNLRQDIINADNLRIFLGSTSHKTFEMLLSALMNDVVVAVKVASDHRERDEAAGKLRFFDDINHKIQDILRKGDYALQRQNELKQLMYDLQQGE